MNTSNVSQQRDEYQVSRFLSLSKRLSLADAVGLEIGACNKPTVPMGSSLCRYADFRSAQEMSHLWNLERSSVCEVDFILNRSLRLSEQISEQFDYIVACHVLEHIPDPIGYILDAGKLLRPHGQLFLMVPDKRKTFDINRPLTKIDHLLMDFYDKCRYPSVEHIVEFHRYVLEIENNAHVPIAEAYEYAVKYHEQGDADVHCHVWDDALFYEQFKYLSDTGFFGDLLLSDFETTPDGLNEFTAVFQRS